MPFSIKREKICRMGSSFSRSPRIEISELSMLEYCEPCGGASAMWKSTLVAPGLAHCRPSSALRRPSFTPSGPSPPPVATMRPTNAWNAARSLVNDSTSKWFGPSQKSL